MANDKLEKMIEFITTNPTVRREYFKDPQVVLAWFLPRNELRAELGIKIEHRIREDKDLASAREAYSRTSSLAMLITRNPELRSEYFESPGKVLAREIPRKGLMERIFGRRLEQTRALRAELGNKVEKSIDTDPRLVSAREAYFEKNAFLTEALQNPERTFEFIVRLSGLAFLIGAALLVGAFAAAIFGEDTTQKAVLGGLSGAGGAATTLGAVFTISRDAVRKANGDNAQIRLILSGFATEITHYRAISIDNVGDARKRNHEIREAVDEAVKRIERYAEPEEERGQAHIGGAHSHPVQT